MPYWSVQPGTRPAADYGRGLPVWQEQLRSRRVQALPSAEQVSALLRTVGVRVWSILRCRRSWQMSTCRCRRPDARPRRRWIVLRMWRASFATAVAGKTLFYFAMAAAGVIMGAASPRL